MCLLGWAGLTTLTDSLKNKLVWRALPILGENNLSLMRKTLKKKKNLCVEDMRLV